MIAIGDTVNSLTTGITKWLKTPFDSRGSALNWLGFVGLLIVIVWFWQVILIDLQKDI